jgi:hypothetical protein
LQGTASAQSAGSAAGSGGGGSNSSDRFFEVIAVILGVAILLIVVAAVALLFYFVHTRRNMPMLEMETKKATQLHRPPPSTPPPSSPCFSSPSTCPVPSTGSSSNNGTPIRPTCCDMSTPVNARGAPGTPPTGDSEVRSAASVQTEIDTVLRSRRQLAFSAVPSPSRAKYNMERVHERVDAEHRV